MKYKVTFKRHAYNKWIFEVNYLNNCLVLLNIIPDIKYAETGRLDVQNNLEGYCCKFGVHRRTGDLAW